jgi:hypothetical protein
VKAAKDFLRVVHPNMNVDDFEYPDITEEQLKELEG